jgi:hypothetical protein
MNREIIEIRRVNSIGWVNPAWEELPHYLWRVDYTAKDNGRIYFEHVRARDELEAYTIVMGFRKQPQPT